MRKANEFPRDRWKGETVVCIASGPSLNREDAEACRGHRVIVCNASFRLAPWADVLLAVDEPWWKEFVVEVRRDFTGELWTTCAIARDKHGLHYARHEAKDGFSTETGVIRGGGNTGQAAVALAYQFGAKRIVLLGYDMQRTRGLSHWHGDYARLRNAGSFGMWITRMERTVRELAALGVEVVNATRETALTRIPCVSLEDELARLRRAA